MAEAPDAGYNVGIVKEVPSGDCMVIMGTNWATGPPPTKIVCLAGLEVPRIGRRDTPDEPFAFGAREFLRKKVIGKRVSFRIEYVVPGGTRELGVVKLGEESLAEAVVGAGWAKLRESKGTPDPVLKGLADAAEAAKIGIWELPTPPSAVRELKTIESEEARGIQERAARDYPDGIPAVVEYIMDAGRMRILMGPPYHVLTFNLSGVSVPSIKRQEDGSEVAAPFAREAKFRVERKVLNRDVNITLEGVDKFGNFFGTLKYFDERRETNLAAELLEEGMAKCVEWSMKFAAQPQELRAAERLAKDARLRMFKNWVPPGEGPNALQDAEYEGTVVEVRSGDTVIIAKGDGQADTITLSSIRAPKLGNARRNAPYEPFSWEAREFVRNYIGKKCLVKLEYKRVLPVSENTPEGMGEKTLVHGTVKVASSKHGPMSDNLAEKLCEAGLVKVIRHREDDDRSEYYDDLLTAEDAAKRNAAESGKLNVQSGEDKLPAPRRFNDLTAQDPSHATARLPFLQRQGKMRAVVEHCYNGARFKLFLPKEGTFLNFALSSVVSPATAGRREGAVDEPFGQEALDFARSKLMQRDVSIHIEGVNRGGTFMGSLGDKTSQWDMTLLRSGLGYIQGYKATDQQYAAEAEAKASKLKVWSVYKEEEEEQEAAAGEDEFMEVEVSEIVEAGHFFTHQRGQKGLEFVAEQLAALELESKTPPSDVPLKGSLVCALWGGDWYRAKILGRTKADDGTPLVRVQFIDYGNADVVVLDQLRPIDAALERIEPLATENRLACVKCPGLDHDFGNDAGAFFRELVWGKPLVTKVEYREGKTQFVTLFEENASASANQAMLREGLARVNAKHKDKKGKLIAQLQEDEAVGKKERLNMWQWGDAVDDEDEAPEFGHKPRT